MCLRGHGPSLWLAGRQRCGPGAACARRARAPDGRGRAGGAGDGSSPCSAAVSTWIVAAAQNRAGHAEAVAPEASGGPSPRLGEVLFPAAGLLRIHGSRPLLRAPPCGRGSTGQPLALPPCRPPARPAGPQRPLPAVSVRDTVTRAFWLHLVVLCQGLMQCHGDTV